MLIHPVANMGSKSFKFVSRMLVDAAVDHAALLV